MSSPAFRCATAARDRDDPLIGTAPTYRTYLLIEHPGPWRFDALSGAGWSADTVNALALALRETRSRLLLIRRPTRRPGRRTGRRAGDIERRWALVRVGIGTSWHTWSEESELLAAAESLRAAVQTSTGLSTDPVLLVCTHGVHDTCCAVRGRPVALALAESWPDATWECSHVGGDRFAANVVVLPDGTYYGGLDAGSAATVVTDHLAGRITLPHLRGSARWPPVAQVAVAEIHRRLGPYGAGEVLAQRWTAQPDGSWLVQVVDPVGRGHLVSVATEARPTAVLTCAASRATSATGFRVASVQALD